MTTYRTHSRPLRFAAASAIAALALSGCAGGAKLSRADASAPGEVSKANKDSERAVARAETAVARNRQDSALRTELGLAYLADGRFDSASAAFNDAMSLGESSPRMALSMALAKTGAGQGREALAILEAQRDSIPVSDLGLAMALAGDSSRGVALLTDALRGGENTPKLRQNLAYAYALDGRWTEARIMMAQDVPADLIDQRITEWAMRAKPDDFRERVAGLIGAPLRSDPGQPVQLALANTPTVEQLAAEASATSPAPANAELAASTEMPIPAPTYGLSEPSATPVVQSTFAESSAALAPRAAAPAQARHRPARTVRIALPAPKPAAAPVATANNGTHLVQLGSFSSEQSAKRAWNLLVARNSNLRGHRMVITPAVVDGKNYWRVAAAGFNSGSANGACSVVKNRGGACFAYAASRVPAGAVTGFAQARLGKAIATRR